MSLEATLRTQACARASSVFSSLGGEKPTQSGQTQGNLRVQEPNLKKNADSQIFQPNQWG